MPSYEHSIPLTDRKKGSLSDPRFNLETNYTYKTTYINVLNTLSSPINHLKTTYYTTRIYEST